MPKLKKSVPKGKHKQYEALSGEDDQLDSTGVEEPSTAIYWLGLGSASGNKMLSEFDLIELGDKGITKRSLELIIRYLGLTRKVMAEEILDISVKTIERKESNEKFDKRNSSHLIEIAKLIQHAYLVFRNQEKVKQWMNRENNALNRKKPANLLHSLTGINLIHDVLGRIEEGVYS